MSECKEFSLQGAPVSEGIAIGHVFFLPATSEELIAEYQVEEKDLIAEVDRYRKAVAKSKEDLLCLKGGLELEGVYEAAQIIGSHMQMLEDPLMTIHIEECIRKLRKNAESVFSSSIREYEKKFSKIKDVFFQQRVVDILDVSKRILGHLCGKTHLNLSEIPYNSIVFAKELIPSHTAALQGVKVGAFVTQQGGGSSHAALIARARGIPYISNIEIEQIQSMRIESVIVDGKRGSLIFNPLPATIKKYQEVSSEQKITYGAFEQDVPSMTQTMDGYVANVHVNIGNLKDLEEVRPYRPEGIGLIRTEYLFPDANIVFLSEEEQIKVYSKILEENMAFSVFRVFDIGGDKNPDLFLEHEKEQNPVLGCRGIRFLLRHPAVFRAQVRAILRAAKGRESQILLPLVSDIEEIRESKRFIEAMRKELETQGYEAAFKVSLGCMIEVPSAALLCEAIAQEVDFLSIGTNDLIQYMMGIDRSNPSISEFFCPVHPSLIRMIKMVALEAKRQNKPVTICGEIASNPLLIPLLLGLGFSEFSCAPRHVPLVKKAIRQCYFSDACEVAHQALQMSSSTEIAKFLLQQDKKDGVKI